MSVPTHRGPKKGYTFQRGTQTALNHEGSKVKTINVKNRGRGIPSCDLGLLRPYKGNRVIMGGTLDLGSWV